jgi:hypothetical protein
MAKKYFIKVENDAVLNKFKTNALSIAQQFDKYTSFIRRIIPSSNGNGMMKIKFNCIVTFLFFLIGSKKPLIRKKKNYLTYFKKRRRWSKISGFMRNYSRRKKRIQE